MPLAGLILALAGAPAGAPPVLALPLDCRFGVACAIQQYPDHDPGPGTSDYRCGQETYDGHDGTDLRVASLALMRAGVTVRAAARAWCGACATGWRTSRSPSSARRRCRGASAATASPSPCPAAGRPSTAICARDRCGCGPGQSVAVGEALGLVGESGDAEFPHLHLTVREAGKAVDPSPTAPPPERAGAAGPCGRRRLRRPWPTARRPC